MLVLHGPNLNLLGTREPALYGRATLAEIDAGLRRRAAALRASIEVHQSNDEGALVGLLQQARGRFDAVILNAAAYTHTSVALRDAVVASGVPCYEVHLTNTKAREPFRRTNLLEDVCAGRIEGFGARGYRMALEAVVEAVAEEGRHGHRHRTAAPAREAHGGARPARGRGQRRRRAREVVAGSGGRGRGRRAGGRGAGGRGARGSGRGAR